MERGQILDEAKAIINGERQDTYGAPEDSFGLIARYWTTYINAKYEGLGKEEKPQALSGKDIALMMTMFKIAREQFQGKRDNLIDAAGYLGIAGGYPE